MPKITQIHPVFASQLLTKFDPEFKKFINFWKKLVKLEKNFSRHGGFFGELSSMCLG
jgi:hypothetical protein